MRVLSLTHSRDFRGAVEQLAARHLVTRPYRPQTNGKAERFVRTLLEEWAYARFYRTNGSCRQQLSRWLRFCNHHRPHTPWLDRLLTQCLSTRLLGTTLRHTYR